MQSCCAGYANLLYSSPILLGAKQDLETLRVMTLKLNILSRGIGYSRATSMIVPPVAFTSASKAIGKIVLAVPAAAYTMSKRSNVESM